MANPQPAPQPSVASAPPQAASATVSSATSASTTVESETINPDEARLDLQLLREFLSLKTTTYYDMLNVSPAASESDIKRAYYQMAKKYHPDRYRPLGMPDILENAEWIFARISEAYEKLRDPEVRRRYDEFIGLVPESTVQTEAKVASVTAPSAPSTPPRTTVGTSTTGSGTSSASPIGGSAGASSQGLGRQTGQATTGSVSAPAETAAETAARSYEMACAAIERKDFITAMTYLREAVRLAPDVIRYRSRLASLCMQNPKLRKEAEEQLLAILKLDENYVDARLALGHMYHQAGMEKSARKQFEAVLAIQPDNAIAKQMLSLIKPATEGKAAPTPPQPPSKPQPPAPKPPEKSKKTEEPKKSLLQQDVGELLGKLFKR